MAFSSSAGTWSGVTSPWISSSIITTGARPQVPRQREASSVKMPSLLVSPQVMPSSSMSFCGDAVGALHVAGRAEADVDHELAARARGGRSGRSWPRRPPWPPAPAAAGPRRPGAPRPGSRTAPAPCAARRSVGSPGAASCRHCSMNATIGSPQRGLGGGFDLVPNCRSVACSSDASRHAWRGSGCAAVRGPSRLPGPPRNVS